MRQLNAHISADPDAEAGAKPCLLEYGFGRDLIS